MKVKDIPVFRQKVLESLPIMQSDVSKLLGIDHRDTSKLIGAMLKDHLIKRTKADKTFLIEKNGSEDEKKHEKDFGALLSNGKFSPCCGCALECDPIHCQKLTEWINEYIKEKDMKNKDKTKI